MRCGRVREQLELHFGAGEVSEEVLRHLEKCQICCAYRDELAQLSVHLGDESHFGVSPSDIDGAIAGVESRIESIAQRKVVPIWRWPWAVGLSRVAAAVLIVAATYGGYQIGRHQMVASRAEVYTPTQGSYETVAGVWSGDSYDELDQGSIDILVEDFGDDRYLGVAEVLLDDLSDEEMEYLMENLTAGDFL